MQLNIRKQAGASLIEIIMVVALMALITIAALTYYNSANEASKVNQAVADITALSSTIRATFASQGDYDGLSEEMIYKMQSVNSNMKSSNANHLKHGWSQATDAIDVETSSSDVSMFEITYARLPQAACQDIASRLIGRFETMTVGSASIDDDATIADIMGACADSNSNSITVEQR